MSFTLHHRHDPPSTEPLGDHPLGRLNREDLDIIVRLVLESGSLKGVAKHYGVSYPTIRNRLNGVIQRLRDAVDGRDPDPLADLLATLVERGELGGTQARRILEAARASTPHGEQP